MKSSKSTAAKCEIPKNQEAKFLFIILALRTKPLSFFHIFPGPQPPGVQTPPSLYAASPYNWRLREQFHLSPRSHARRKPFRVISSSLAYLLTIIDRRFSETGEH